MCALPRLCCPQASRDYLSKLLTMGRVMTQQASGRPTGPHAVFKELLVDAATVRLSTTGWQAAPACTPATCALHLAEYLELTLRRWERRGARGGEGARWGRERREAEGGW